MSARPLIAFALLALSVAALFALVLAWAGLCFGGGPVVGFIFWCGFLTLCVAWGRVADALATWGAL